MAELKFVHGLSRFQHSGVPYGAMVETIGRVKDWSGWCAEWARTGEEFETAGDAARDGGHVLTARDHYLVAAACYHYGEYLFVEDLDLKLSTLHRCVDVFQKAIPYIKPAIERVEIPFRNTFLPAYFCSATEGRQPVVVKIQGLDSIKEVETYNYSRRFVERRVATLMFDGPGQSEAWERVRMDVHYEDAVSAVIDYLVTRPDVDASAIGVYGGSLGGYLAPRAAAMDGRIRAAVGLAGPFDMHAWVAKTPAERQERVRVIWGADTWEELMTWLEGATLDALPGARCPLLIVHGALDKVVPVEEARRIYAWAKGERRLAVFEGSDHNCSNRWVESSSLIADWLADHLRG